MDFNRELIRGIPRFSFGTDGANVVCVVGGTGTGKTTTIASLAGNLRINREPPEHLNRITLLSLDTYHLAGSKKLKILSDISGIPFFTPADTGELIKIYHEHKAKTDVFLLDTPGISPNDADRLNELKNTLAVFASQTKKQPCVLLVIPAQTDARHAVQVLEAFAGFRYAAVIITKLDECLCAENLTAVLRKKQIPVSVITVGENIPQDIIILYSDGDEYADR